MTFITLTGNIMSLCLGATVSASALIFLASLSLGVAWACLLAMLFGIIITAAQGMLIGYLRANPILVSIAGLSLLIGAAALATGGQRIYPGGAGLQMFKGRIIGIPVETIYFFATAAIGQYIVSWTRLGRVMVMVGSNLRAATAAGNRHRDRGHRRLCHRRRLLGGFRCAARRALRFRRHGDRRRLRLCSNRRGAGGRHQHPGRLRLRAAHDDRRDRYRHH
jgi:ABC-type xylose transport system permease subunit